MPVDLETVHRHLLAEDPVSLLLRGHLWVDQALTDLIREAFEFPDEWEDLERLSFHSKVDLARAQGSLPWVSALRELHRLRNQLAHNPRFEIDQDAARRLVKSFEPDFGTLDEPGDVATRPRTDEIQPNAHAIRQSVLALLTYLMYSTLQTARAKDRRLQTSMQGLNALLSEQDIERSTDRP